MGSNGGSFLKGAVLMAPESVWHRYWTLTSSINTGNQKGNLRKPWKNCGKPWFNNLRASQFFPRASERRVLPIAGVCLSSSHLHIFSLHIFSSSHLLIFTSSHLHIFSSSHLLIFTTSHLHIFSSSHLLIFTSGHLHICSSSHLHICSSSHLLILTSSHLHILTSSHLLLLPSWPLALLPSSSHLHILTSSHLHHIIHPHIFTSSPLALLPSCPSCPSCPLLLFYFSSEGGGRGSANETARNATLSHEMRFDRQKLM